MVTVCDSVDNGAASVMNAHGTRTRILLADSHSIMREGLYSLLSRERDMEVVGQACNGREAIRMARDLNPDVVVMEVSMPELSGLHATVRIRREMPGIKVIALSMHSDRHFVNGMLGAGTSAYVLKSETVDELLRAIRSVRSDRVYTSPRVTDVVMRHYFARLSQPDVDASSLLTPRESQVLGLLAEGYTTRQIAERLHLSMNTIDTHRRRITQKLDIHSIAELTKYAIREGIISIDE